MDSGPGHPGPFHFRRSARGPLLCDKTTDRVEQLFPSKRLSQRWNVIEQPIGIGHWITDMQDGQSRPFATDRPDEVSIRDGTPAGVGDEEIQVGNHERQFAGRSAVVSGKHTVASIAEGAYQEGHEPRIIVGNDYSHGSGRYVCH